MIRISLEIEPIGWHSVANAKQVIERALEGIFGEGFVTVIVRSPSALPQQTRAKLLCPACFIETQHILTHRGQPSHKCYRCGEIWTEQECIYKTETVHKMEDL